MERFEKQGHRGCAGLMPENTIASMLKAVELGVTNLELDIALTKDDLVVVSHDPFLNHVIATKPNGEPVSLPEEKVLIIRGLNYSEVKKYDVGLRPNPAFPNQAKIPANIPLLSDLINAVEAFCKAQSIPPVTYNVEIKSSPSGDGIYYPSVRHFVDALIRVVEVSSLRNRVVVISFDERALQYVHNRYPVFKTGLISENLNAFDSEMASLSFIPDYYSPEYTSVDSSLITKCKANGMKVVPWSVNELAEIERLKHLGVSGIITDYPNLL